jgi:hypothetical protein
MRTPMLQQSGNVQFVHNHFPSRPDPCVRKEIATGHRVSEFSYASLFFHHVVAQC